MIVVVFIRFGSVFGNSILWMICIGVVFIVWEVLINLVGIFSRVFLIIWVINGVVLMVNGIIVVCKLIDVLIIMWVNGIIYISKIMNGMEWKMFIIVEMV